MPWVLNFDQLRHPYGYQVVRSEFDQTLLEHAKSQGVKVYEGTEIKSIAFDGDRPVSATWNEIAHKENSGEISFDFLVDASGRAGIMANRYLKNRHIHEAFQNVAVWGYWQGTISMNFAPSGHWLSVRCPMVGSGRFRYTMGHRASAWCSISQRSKKSGNKENRWKKCCWRQSMNVP